MSHKPNESLKTYWRSVQSRKTRLAVLGSNPHASTGSEFRPGADELVVEGGASRRKFMGLLGASTALAGLTSTGCVRKPVQHILPFAKRPEDRIPGMPMYYATAYQVGGTVQGLLVESHDGRPTKIEGNPQHGGSQGATDVFAQASILSLYDPERSKQVMSRTVSAHAFGEPGQAEQSKTEVANGICHRLRERTLEHSKSVDAANAAAVSCEERVASKDARWNIYVGEDGREVTELSIDWDEQVETTWGDAFASLAETFAKFHSGGGQGLALVVPGSLSPSFRAAQQRFVQNYPKAKVVLCDPTYPINSIRAAEMVAGEGARHYYSIEDATLIVALDSDFLGVDQDHVRLTREYARKRKVGKPGDADKMNRLYVVEPHLTSTGAQADERLRLPAVDVVDFLAGLIIELVDTHKLGLPMGSEQFASVIAARGAFDDRTQRFIVGLAADLAGRINRTKVRPDEPTDEKVAIMVGERQPPLAHGLGFLLSAMFKADSANPPGSLRFSHRLDQVPYQNLGQLAAQLDDGSVTAVVCLGANPAYEAPGGLGLRDKLAKAKLLVHAGTHLDETGRLAHWHLPMSHYLEAWGDLEAFDGTTSIQQPLIAPLHDTRSALEILAILLPLTDGAGKSALSSVEQPGDKLVREHWNAEIHKATEAAPKPEQLSDKTWRRWLHEGLVSGIPRSPTLMRPNSWTKFADLMVGRKVEDAPFEIDFHLDPKVMAGEFSNNAWMQELPHPISKLVWDNAAYISAALAAQLGVENGDNLAIKVGQLSLQVPAWISPGQHDRTVSLTLGYGRKNLGTVAEGSGFDVNPLRTDESRWFAGGEVGRGAGKYKLVSTQDYGSLDPDGPEGTPILNFEPRPIYREATVEQFKENPEFSKLGDLMPPERLRSPWARYDPETDPTLSVPVLTGPHQWGMSIDLNSCTACNACVIACQAENNIAVVGKKECSNGREMHWIRIDRYYTGAEDNPEAVVMPMLCQHCETAPCENVCPVAATAHSPEGLNDMAYNRCIGTRYCANNCPYKVRRFNFYKYNKNMPETVAMQKNPDVTVRFRGVIEKCSYCVQRIQAAKIEAHIDGRDKVRDLEVIVACQQVCPAEAIVFGDITDPNSQVSRVKYASRQVDYAERKPALRDYAVLQDLLTIPRTTYLARVRNPNPELA